MQLLYKLPSFGLKPYFVNYSGHAYILPAFDLTIAPSLTSPKSYYIAQGSLTLIKTNFPDKLITLEALIKKKHITLYGETNSL